MFAHSVQARLAPKEGASDDVNAADLPDFRNEFEADATIAVSQRSADAAASRRRSS
jgi:hypothetical protein